MIVQTMLPVVLVLLGTKKTRPAGNKGFKHFYKSELDDINHEARQQHQCFHDRYLQGSIQEINPSKKVSFKFGPSRKVNQADEVYENNAVQSILNNLVTTASKVQMLKSNRWIPTFNQNMANQLAVQLPTLNQNMPNQLAINNNIRTVDLKNNLGMDTNYNTNFGNQNSFLKTEISSAPSNSKSESFQSLLKSFYNDNTNSALLQPQQEIVPSYLSQPQTNINQVTSDSAQPTYLVSYDNTQPIYRLPTSANAQTLYQIANDMNFQIPTDNTQPMLQIPAVNSQPVYLVANDNAQPIFQVANDNTQPIFQVANDNTQPIFQVANDNTQPMLQVANDNAQSMLQGLLANSLQPKFKSAQNSAKLDDKINELLQVAREVQGK